MQRNPKRLRLLCYRGVAARGGGSEFYYRRKSMRLMDLRTNPSQFHYRLTTAILNSFGESIAASPFAATI
jgi:hypothetical protein